MPFKMPSNMMALANLDPFLVDFLVSVQIFGRWLVS
jgi:hypothetical protein